MQVDFDAIVDRIESDTASAEDRAMFVHCLIADAYGGSDLDGMDFADLLRTIADDIEAGDWDEEQTEH
jgi:hypothetical protein